jgi:UDP-N-acetylmuramyl pentapeptide phosphotransferase/UDP-N-acetylglucosamine-1-phosphate transferase
MIGQSALSPLVAVALAAALSFALTGIAMIYARRRRLFDYPGERHSHTRVTPRGGGAGLVAAFILASIFFNPWGPADWWLTAALPCLLVLAVTGWWDDHTSLSVRFRFLVQLTVSVCLIWCATDAGWLHGIFRMVIGGLFVLWMINLYNFMDGSNGMAGFQGVFVSIVLASLFYLAGDLPMAMAALLLTACCAGFLPWNLGQAKVFLGDVGSLSLGFIFAALLIYGSGTGAFSYAIALMVMLLFLTDAGLTLLWRVIRGERWYNAHRQHLYQRMIAQGWTHGRVLLFYQAINALLILPGIMIAVRFPAWDWAVAIASTLMFIVGWHLLRRKFGEPVLAG